MAELIKALDNDDYEAIKEILDRMEGEGYEGI